MISKVQFEPLSTWPRPRIVVRKGKKFGISFTATLKHLDRELKNLKADSIVIEADFRRDDIRNDGFPRAGRMPSDPGVILSFLSIHGPLRLPCDHFKDWTQNLRAIGLHLEMLRRASLYGVGQFGEQYKGWLRLGAGTAITILPSITVEEASRILAAITLRTDVAKLINMNPPEAWQVDNYRSIYRKAASIAHPDANGGNAEVWDKLQRAKAVLDEFHGIAKNAGGKA